MTFKHLFVVFLSILHFSCNQGEKYTPEGLRKLSEKELLVNAEKRQTFNHHDNYIYKNENGQILSLDSVSKIPNIQEWTADRYINDNNEIKELILRKATEKDKEFQKKLNAIYEKETFTEETNPVIQIGIDCNNTKEILTKVYALDQDMRTNGNGFNPKIDRENLVTVVSLIEQCGMPTLKEVNQEQMSAIWFVFQHADNYHRKKYYAQLKESALNGDLPNGKIALMEDRILMMDGKPQIYGSQISEDRINGGWKIYDLENPENVDKRRAEVGLQPLNEYVKQWDIEFNTRQDE